MLMDHRSYIPQQGNTPLVFIYPQQKLKPEHKNTKTQKHKNTKTQKHKNTKTQKPIFWILKIIRFWHFTDFINSRFSCLDMPWEQRRVAFWISCKITQVAERRVACCVRNFALIYCRRREIRFKGFYPLETFFESSFDRSLIIIQLHQLSVGWTKKTWFLLNHLRENGSESFMGE